MAYTFDISSRAYDDIDQYYEDIGYLNKYVFKVGEYYVNNTIQHVLRPPKELIDFMTKYIGDKPYKIMRTKPVWTNFKYVAKIYFNKKEFEKEIITIQELKKKDILCPDIVDIFCSSSGNILISEYVGKNIDNDELWSQYYGEYQRIIKKLRKLDYNPDPNPENYCVKDGKLYVIDFEEWT